MRAAVAPRELARRRGRRHVGDRAQLSTRGVGAQPLQIEHRVTAAQLRLGDGDEQLPGRATPRALLDRRKPADPRDRLDRPIQRRDQLQPADQLAEHRRPAKRRQRLLIRDDLDPRRLPEPIASRPPPRTPLTLGL
jgi:hypothetical protein